MHKGGLMFENKKGFTLTELLIALTIIGAVAVLTIPSLMSSINEKVFTSKYSNIKLQIQQLATDQILHHKVKTIEDTDFDNPSTLLENNFDSVGVPCSISADEDEEQGCWDSAYRNPDGTELKIKIPKSSATITLKNGAVLLYTNDSTEIAKLVDSYDSEQHAGYFLVDLNGSDSPNILGTDLFAFTVNKKGKISDADVSPESEEEEEEQPEESPDEDTPSE